MSAVYSVGQSWTSKLGSKIEVKGGRSIDLIDWVRYSILTQGVVTEGVMSTANFEEFLDTVSASPNKVAERNALRGLVIRERGRAVLRWNSCTTAVGLRRLGSSF